MKIILGSDHAGFDYKEDLIKLLREKNIFFKDCGCFSSDSVDYPDYAHTVSREVLKNKDHLGVLICGSANGVAMAANKHKGIRAAICWTKKYPRCLLLTITQTYYVYQLGLFRQMNKRKYLKRLSNLDLKVGDIS